MLVLQSDKIAYIIYLQNGRIFEPLFAERHKVMLNQTNSVKYTAVLPQECLNELRSMAEQNVIPSVNQGIRAAVENYVNAHRLREYQRGIREAAADKAFIRRTMDTQTAFEFVDAEGEAEW